MKRIALLIALLAAGLVLAGIALLAQDGDEATVAIEVTDAWVRPTLDEDAMAEMEDMESMGAPAFPVAVFMTLTNNGDSDDRLLTASSPDAGLVEIHTTTVEDDVMRMAAIDGLDLPAGESVLLEPGGYHLMLFDLTRELLPGETLTLTLSFESGLELEVEAAVEDRGGMDHDMGGMDHDMGGMGDMMPVTLHVAATVGDAAALCEGRYTGIGTDDAEITFSDFRFYLSNVELLAADGSATPLMLEQDGAWQVDNVVLLDFEDGTAGCSEIGNAALNGEIRGMAPHGAYTGLRFDLGVPFALNHQDVTLAPSPLNLAALWWNWQGGYKFIRVDLVTHTADESAPWNLHIGSTGCLSPASVAAPEEPCLRPNVPTITFASFDLERDAIVADLGGLLAGVPLYDNTPMPPGCMSGIDDPDCEPLYPGFGLSLASGMCPDDDCSAQTFFRVGEREDLELVGRTALDGEAMPMGEGGHDHGG